MVLSSLSDCSFRIIVSSLCTLLPGNEVCTQGRTRLPGMEKSELSRPETLAVPGAVHPAHDGPRRTVDTESGLARKRGQDVQRGWSEQRRQQLNRIESDGKKGGGEGEKGGNRL